MPIEEVNVELTPGNVLTMDTMMVPLGTFKVTKCSIHSINSEQVHLAIHLQRISSSFWMSFLIPYIFIVLAAEITLFIDESHFKATFTVAITTNVVMYTSVQAEFFLFSDPTFLEGFDLKFHMPGHFPPMGCHFHLPPGPFCHFAQK